MTNRKQIRPIGQNAHGEIREGHAATLRRGYVSLIDHLFTATDDGRLYAAFCECGASAIGGNAAEALEYSHDAMGGTEEVKY